MPLPPEPAQQQLIKFKEIAELLVKHKGIHEGYWGIFVRFGLTATNIRDNTGEMFPAAVIPLTEMGIQRFEEPNSLTVDAAIVNPAKPA